MKYLALEVGGVAWTWLCVYVGWRIAMDGIREARRDRPPVR